MNMPACQNRSNFAFRNGVLRLATMSTAQSGLKSVLDHFSFVKKYLGEGLVKKTLHKAFRMLSMVDKYQQDMLIAEYLTKKLQER